MLRTNKIHVQRLEITCCGGDHDIIDATCGNRSGFGFTLSDCNYKKCYDFSKLFNILI